ncbi:MAG: hypothetical protein APR63_08680 [Desulfuromonas sp. SDB]|nr:MAG: hypothetical protein APR63_08680 [Desulfuromonas sp. SDB]
MHTDKRNKRIELLEILNHAKIAGTERHVLLLATNLDNNLFNTSICTFENGDLVNNLKKNINIKTKVISYRKRFIHFYRLIKFLRNSNFDLIHSHSGGYACIAGKIAGIRRIIYTKHGVGFTKKELDNLNIKTKISSIVVDKCVNHYIALTKNDKNTLIKYFKIKPNKISVIPNGIDISFIDNVKKEESKEIIIGTVTRLMPQKGLKYFIKAIPRILNYNSKINFKIAGTGSQKGELVLLANNLKIKNKIDFSGYITDVANYINNLDIFILPSIWEGFPYVLLEAMILKKPIITTDIFGINEIIKNNHQGILVKPYNHKQIADSVIKLLKDSKLARYLGESAYRKVLKNYTLDKNVKSIQSLYLKILK